MPKARNKSPQARPMRISQVAAAAGVPVQTVEYYILLGLVEPIRRPGQRGRHFTSDHVKRIQLIRHLNESGYTLQAIRQTYLRKR